MKYLKTYEEVNNNLKIYDYVHVYDWNDAKILKVYKNNTCLIQFEDGFTTTLPTNELTLFTEEELKELELKKTQNKYNL